MTYAVPISRSAAFLLCWESSSCACDYFTHKIKTAGPEVVLELILKIWHIWQNSSNFSQLTFNI